MFVQSEKLIEEHGGQRDQVNGFGALCVHTMFADKPTHGGLTGMGPFLMVISTEAGRSYAPSSVTKSLSDSSISPERCTKT